MRADLSAEVPRARESGQDEERRRTLWALFEVLDGAGVPYCLLRGYQGHLAGAGSDVDFVVEASWLPARLAALLDAHRERIGARVVQWNEANYVVLVADGTDAAPCLLHLDFATDLRRAGRLFFTGVEVLAGRRRYERWWAPARGVEFAYACAEKIIKGTLSPADGQRLSGIYQGDPAGCAAQVCRLWDPNAATVVLAAATSGYWDSVLGDLPRLRADALRRATRQHPLAPVTGCATQTLERARRWLRPRDGLHIVLLGPDGVGKSSVIDAVRTDLRGAFGGEARPGSFAPSFFGGRAEAVRLRSKKGPHALPPRSLLASLLKGAFWVLYYSLGYYVTIRPALARNALMINDRYLVDTLVDQRRYRYGGPGWLLRLAWRLARKPHLVILLDAPAEVIQSRKREVPFAETARQRESYRRLVERMPNGEVVDAARPLPEVVASVNGIVLHHLARRARSRFGLDARR